MRRDRTQDMTAGSAEGAHDKDTSNPACAGDSPRAFLVEKIRQQAQCHERAGRLAEAVKCWTVLDRPGLQDGVASVARSQVTRLNRRIEHRRHAEQLVSRGKDALEEGVEIAEQAARWGLVVEVRRIQAARERNIHNLTALGSALRRAGEHDQARAVLAEAIAIDPSKTSNRAAYVAMAALLREVGQRAGARALLEELRDLGCRDRFTAACLAGVYLDYIESHGQVSLLEPTRYLIDLAYAQDPGATEIRMLYRRLDAVKRKRKLP